MKKIIEQLAQKNGPSVADQCKRTLLTVMENANENINNKIIDILEKVGLKVGSLYSLKISILLGHCLDIVATTTFEVSSKLIF